MMIRDIIVLSRPLQWVKNLFVFVPLFFSGRLMSFTNWDELVWTFIAFSLVSSSIYVINDSIDAKEDRLHPLKCHRPIACGAVSVRTAAVVAMAYLLASGVIAWLLLGAKVTAIIGAYFVMNLAYCLKLKQIAILDILIISIGFVLRILVGGVAADIVLSYWIVLMTFLLTLFLALAKRRDDVLIYEREQIKARSNISHYNMTFVNQSMSVISAVMIVCYVMYTVSPEVVTRLDTHYLYLTTLFVVAGVLRYMQISFVEQQSGDPTKVLLRDYFLKFCVLAWAVSFLIILYA